MTHFLISLLLTLAVASPVSALESTDIVEQVNPVRRAVQVRENAQAKRQEVRENIQTKRQEVKENVEARRLEMKEQFATKRAEFASRVASNHADRISKRFDLYTTRLTNIIARFQSRLDALTAEGVDITTIQNQLDIASTSLATASDQAQGVVDAFFAIDSTSDTYKEDIAAAKALVTEVRSMFQQVHTDLREALSLLKNLRTNTN